MVQIRYSEEASAAYEMLDASGQAELLDAIDEALNELIGNPGSPVARHRSFAGAAGFGMTARTRHDDWLIIWEPDSSDAGLVWVRYIGPDPFA